MTTTLTHINTESVRRSNLTLVVLPDQNRTASGDLFWDDGESIDSVERLQYNYFTFELLSNCSLVIFVEHSGSESNGQTIDFIDVYNTKGSNIKAELDGQALAARPPDSNLRTRIEANIDLGSKPTGEQWIVSWSCDHQCNLI